MMGYFKRILHAGLSLLKKKQEYIKGEILFSQFELPLS